MDKHILIAEDEEPIAYGLARAFTKKGYQTHVAGNFKEAKQAISQHPVNLVITDIMMPHTGGLELLELIRSSPEAHDLPVILISAIDQEIMSATVHEADAVFSKPFNLQSLVEKSEQLLRERLS